MTVHLYTVCWNEAHMLGFFFRHYDPWVDRYVIYDDGSTDQTMEILKERPRVEVRQFNRSCPDSFIVSRQELYNHVWKESRGQADWAIIMDIDEHLFVPGCPMRDYLRRCTAQGVTLLPALGYQMLSGKFPDADEFLCHTRTRGAPFQQMNKTCLFNPDAVEEINSSVGNHWAWPVGRLKLPRRDELLLLHYKYMGFDNLLERYELLKNRRTAQDIANKWGQHYSQSRAELREEWNNFEKEAMDISRPDLNPHLSHPSKRWWRPAWKFFVRRLLARIVCALFGHFPNMRVRGGKQ